MTVIQRVPGNYPDSCSIIGISTISELNTRFNDKLNSKFLLEEWS